MENILKTFFDITKLPTKFIFLLSIVTGFILFIDEDFINKKLYLDSLKMDYGWILGVVFILSTGLVIVNIIIWIFHSIQKILSKKQWKKNIKETVQALDEYEQAILREFIISGQKSIEMPVDNQNIAGLLNAGILEMNSALGSTVIMKGSNVSLSINRSVMQTLEFKDIGLSNPPTKEEVIKLECKRPKWN